MAQRNIMFYWRIPHRPVKDSFYKSASYNILFNISLLVLTSSIDRSDTVGYVVLYQIIGLLLYHICYNTIGLHYVDPSNTVIVL